MDRKITIADHRETIPEDRVVPVRTAGVLDPELCDGGSDFDGEMEFVQDPTLLGIAIADAERETREAQKKAESEQLPRTPD